MMSLLQSGGLPVPEVLQYASANIASGRDVVFNFDNNLTLDSNIVFLLVGVRQNGTSMSSVVFSKLAGTGGTNGASAISGGRIESQDGLVSIRSAFRLHTGVVVDDTVSSITFRATDAGSPLYVGGYAFELEPTASVELIGDGSCMGAYPGFDINSTVGKFTATQTSPDDQDYTEYASGAAMYVGYVVAIGSNVADMSINIDGKVQPNPFGADLEGAGLSMALCAFPLGAKNLGPLAFDAESGTIAGLWMSGLAFMKF